MVLQYVAALVLVAHGIGHSVGFLRPWFGIDAGSTDKPWILPGNHAQDSQVGQAWGIIWLAALVLFVGSGVGVFVVETWWRPLAIVGSVASIVAILPWWNTVIAGAKAGVALDVAIILVLLLPWGEEVTDFFEVP